MDEQKPDQSKKSIIAVPEIGVNYVFHLVACARIGFDSDYADRYQNSVSGDDLAFMTSHRERLTFGGGSGGDLVDILIGLPACLKLDSKTDFESYYSLLLQGCADNDFAGFLTHFAEPIRKLKDWWSAPHNEGLRELAPRRDIIRRLGDITLRNYDAFADSVWPVERPKLERVASRINEAFASSDRIGEWEKLVGRVFKYDPYHIVLCSAIQNGPNANSIGYDRVVFYHDWPLEETLEFISHEVGTHLLIDDLKRAAASGQFDFPALYEAYECLAYHYNALLLGKNRLAYHRRMHNFRLDKYVAAYREVHGRDAGIDPYDLLMGGLEIMAKG